MKEGLCNIDIVIPMYNEQQSVIAIVENIQNTLQNHFGRINYILVDDGSTDNTEKEIKKIKINREKYNLRYIKLSKNFGKDMALKCGVDHSTSNVCVMIDADFQHPPKKIIEALVKLREGYNIVHIIKQEYSSAHTYRRLGSSLYKKLLNFLCGAKIALTDFKVIDKKAVDTIKKYGENLYFSAGVIGLIGFKTATIEYEPSLRKYGKSKFTVFSLGRLARRSIMAVSIKPLRVSIYFGMIISSIAFLYGLYIIFEKVFLGQPIPGFATLGAAMFFLGGVQLLFLGILGEYLGKAFIETKRRPQYLIDYIIDL